VLGVFIVTRPLTSLWLLAVLVGTSAILSGILGLSDATAESRGERPTSGTASSASVDRRLGRRTVWLGRSIELLPAVLGLLADPGRAGLARAA
jgi:hypothetical protein